MSVLYIRDEHGNFIPIPTIPYQPIIEMRLAESETSEQMESVRGGERGQ